MLWLVYNRDMSAVPLRRVALLVSALVMALVVTAGVLTMNTPHRSRSAALGQGIEGFGPELESTHCPVERGPVKAGSDADRNKVSATVLNTTVVSLRSKPKPSTYPNNNRITSTEFHIWALTAFATQYKSEADGDIHLVIKDASGNSMIAELPAPTCEPSSSRWQAAIDSARATFVHTYPSSTSWHYIHRLTDLRGVGFMDVLHGQAGVAPDGVELHPVLYIHFR